MIAPSPSPQSIFKILLMPFISIARHLLSPWIPKLKQLSNEEVYSEPIYRVLLLTVSLSLVYLALGLAALFSSSATGVFSSEVATVSLAALVMILAASIALKYTIQERLRASSQADARKADDPLFRDLESARLEREQVEERLFRRNLNDEFVLKAFEWSRISFFEDGDYRFTPRVNVLLGKNGYGKTLLFRSLAALLQRDREYSSLVFRSSGGSPPSNSNQASPRLSVLVTRNGETEEIIRDATYFVDSVGKIPLLAIPDSRFVNRARRTVAGAASSTEPLAKSGARQFLTQEPYENVVQDLLTQLCLDYRDARSGHLSRIKGFDQPIFRLVETVVRELTEDEAFRFAEIKRAGTSGFEILVHTAGSLGVPIPIQSASQGTLSIVAIFGLIYSFLHSLRPEENEDEASTGSGIVLIDEIDAHLHPSWQQKMLGMLTRSFPNVQFIVSAHSPIIVAGCDMGEVSVLRRRSDTGAFYVDTLPEDFLGANAQDLYKRVFEIEDADRLYLEYSTKGMTGGDERERDIQRLEKKQRRSRADEDRLNFLQRESRLVGRAAEAREQRLRSERTQADIAVLEAEIERLQYGMREKEGEIERLKQAVRGQQGEAEDARPRVSE